MFLRHCLQVELGLPQVLVDFEHQALHHFRPRQVGCPHIDLKRARHHHQGLHLLRHLLACDRCYRLIGLEMHRCCTGLLVGGG